MKAVTSFAMVLLVALVASPAVAQEGNVSQSTLSQLGLSGMQVMTDTEGMEIRGMSAWSSSGGGSIVSGGLIYNDGNETYFVSAGSANSAGSGSSTRYRRGTRAGHSQGSDAGATLYVGGFPADGNGGGGIPIASFGGSAGGYGKTGASTFRYFRYRR